MNKLYSVHDHWTDINKKNDVDIESIDGVITGIKVNGEDYGGGGGSSDLSTAEVTSSNDSEENLTVTVIGEIGPNKESVIASNLKVGKTKSAVLYKGHQYVTISPQITVTVVSGSAEVLEEINPMFGTVHFLDIKGDCTILVTKPGE